MSVTSLVIAKDCSLDEKGKCGKGGKVAAASGARPEDDMSGGDCENF
jgi:hypothetical protein